MGLRSWVQSKVCSCSFIGGARGKHKEARLNGPKITEQLSRDIHRQLMISSFKGTPSRQRVSTPLAPHILTNLDAPLAPHIWRHFGCTIRTAHLEKFWMHHYPLLGRWRFVHLPAPGQMARWPSARRYVDGVLFHLLHVTASGQMAFCPSARL